MFVDHTLVGWRFDSLLYISNTNIVDFDLREQLLLIFPHLQNQVESNRFLQKENKQRIICCIHNRITNFIDISIFPPIFFPKI